MLTVKNTDGPVVELPSVQINLMSRQDFND